jgi:hypothetical protein
MESQYKPANYSTVSPYLIVNGADATIDFLKRVFGAIELRRFPDESGKLMHAEVRIDDTVIIVVVTKNWTLNQGKMPCPVKETANEKTSFVQARAKSPRSLAGLDRPEKRRSDLSRASDRRILALALEEAFPRWSEQRL